MVLDNHNIFNQINWLPNQFTDHVKDQIITVPSYEWPIAVKEKLDELLKVIENNPVIKELAEKVFNQYGDWSRLAKGPSIKYVRSNLPIFRPPPPCTLSE